MLMNKCKLVVFFYFLVSFNLNAQNTLSNSGILAKHQPSLLLSHPQGETHALVLVNTKANDSFFNTLNIKVNAKIGNIWSVQFAAKDLEKISQLPCFDYIEIATKANAARFKNDIERQATSVDKVQNGLTNGLPLNYTGKGVVVGIVDIGFQGNNPTFFDNAGKQTRITRIWQQNNKNGTPPIGYNYGTELTDTTSIINSNDMDGSHGTHVGGIAAGSGFSTPNMQYKGMAPQAELVFVGIKYSNDTLGGSALGDYIIANPTIIDAYKYIFDYAQSIGKPAVINLSWGMHTGPHDGSSLFDKATEQLVGKGKVLVGANGNEGDNPMHWNCQFNNDTAKTIAIENSRQNRNRESVYVDFWGSKNTDFKLKISIIDTNKNIVAETPFISSTSNTLTQYNLSADSNNFKISFACTQANTLNQKPNITLNVFHNNPKKHLILLSLTSTNSMVHAWNSGATREWTSGSFRNKVGNVDLSNQAIAGNTDYTCGENGGTSKAVISVGAMAARSAFIRLNGTLKNDSSYVLPGAIAKFSSKGPTVDGRIKPDIAAPGFAVPSAVNNKQFQGWELDRTLLKTAFRGDTNYWVAYNGTSMASPHVCGIVALLLQANPNLTAAQIKNILHTTATANTATGSVPNNQYGYGIVNAFEAIKSTLQQAGINAFNSENEVIIYPNPALNILNIQTTGQYHIEISCIDGKKMIQTKEMNGNNAINIENLSKGIYIVSIIKEKERHIFKLLKE